MNKAQVLYEDMDEKDEPFKASSGRLRGFMNRYGLFLRRKTSMAQKEPDQLIDKFDVFVLHVRRLNLKHTFGPSDIIVMMKPLSGRIWFQTQQSMILGKNCLCKDNWTRKSRVSVCLAAKTDGTKLPPFIIFKGAKREFAALDIGIRKCYIVLSPNAWMNT